MGFFSSNKVIVARSSKTSKGGSSIVDKIDVIAQGFGVVMKNSTGGQGVESRYDSQEYSHKCEVDARRNIDIWSR